MVAGTGACSSSTLGPGAEDSGAGATDSSVGGDAGEAGGVDSSSSCLLCSDASFEDVPLVVQVRGEIDAVCSNIDGCHGSNSGGMTLLPGSEFNAMINVTSTENPPMKRVLPGDPAQSYVYLKLACDGGIKDACMPLGAPNAGTAKIFWEWIEAGAPTQ